MYVHRKPSSVIRYSDTMANEIQPSHDFQTISSLSIPQRVLQFFQTSGTMKSNSSVVQVKFWSIPSNMAI